MDGFVKRFNFTAGLRVVRSRFDVFHVKFCQQFLKLCDASPVFKLGALIC